MLRVDDPATEAELTVETIQYQGSFAMKRLSPLYHTEKRAIGTTTWATAFASLNYGQQEFRKLHQSFFRSALALGLGVPDQNDWQTQL